MRNIKSVIRSHLITGYYFQRFIRKDSLISYIINPRVKFAGIQIILEKNNGDKTSLLSRLFLPTLSRLESLHQSEKQPLKSGRKKLKILLHWGAIARSHASFCATKSRLLELT